MNMFHISLLIGATLLIVCVYARKTKLALAVAIVTMLFMAVYSCAAKEKEVVVTKLTEGVQKAKVGG